MSAEVVTNESGLYYVRNLPIGTYTLTFSKPGFKSLERKGLTLQVSQIAEIDVWARGGHDERNGARERGYAAITNPDGRG